MHALGFYLYGKHTGSRILPLKNKRRSTAHFLFGMMNLYFSVISISADTIATLGRHCESQETLFTVCTNIYELFCAEFFCTWDSIHLHIVASVPIHKVCGIPKLPPYGLTTTARNTTPRQASSGALTSRESF